MFSAIARVFRTPDLRRKIGFTLAIIAIYRLGAHVPTPFVSYPNVQDCLRESGSANEGLLSLVNLFSGGALLQLSIFALGVMPYITATIIVQLLRVVIPHFEALYKEGQAGQAKLTQYTRYLTLVLAALLVRLLMRYHRSHKLYAWWGTGLLFGMAASLLILTLSRTGYLAAGVMGLVIWLFVSLFCYRERAGAFFAKTGILILIVLAAFPVTYSAVRLIPPLYDDPYLFELEAEPAEWAIHKGDRADSENYITFPRFAYCFDGKIFGDEHRVLREFVDTFMAQADTPAVVSEAADASGTGGAKEAAPAGTRTAAPAVKEAFALTASADETAGNPAEAAQTSEETAQAAGQADAGASSGPVEEEEGGDISNGRFALFQKYIAQWNLTGHELMGVPLEDGSLSVHAHNTYLQVIHDHGLITGAAFILLGVVTLIQMVRYAYHHLYRLRRRQEKRDEYAALPLAVFVAFAAAGLVEWLFHPCNPMGFAVMAALAPLLIFKRKEK